SVVDLLLVDGVEAKDAIGLQRAMHAGDTGFQPFDIAAVVDGVQEAGNQIHRLAQAELAHVLQGKAGFGAAYCRQIQHRLIDIEPAALVATIDKVSDVRPGPAGKIQMTYAAVPE